MKIDRKFRKTLTEIPKDCKLLIESLKSCTDNDQLFNEIFTIKTWNIGKCELYHWADVLDRFDAILETSCVKLSADSWQLACDLPENLKLKKLLLALLQFTALLIEHSYSRHLYNSIEHLTTLLESTDFYVILSVLNLLYVFSKRSIFIARLLPDKKQALLQRLLYLAESWGGKENGLDLVKCCCFTDLNNFPASATTVNFEYSNNANQETSNLIINSTNMIIGDLNQKSLHTKTIKLEKVHLINDNPAVIMEKVLSEHDVPEDKRVLLYTYIRLAHSFPSYEKRKLFVQARLQSLSILVYSAAIQDHVNNLLYDGLIEELVDVLNVKEFGFSFPEIKAASLKTLTAIIHLEKANKLNDIIDTTQASSYHGLLPTLVRKCVDHLIDSTKEPFPHQFATALFSFLYHLATYDTGGDALVKCGIMETLLKVVNHNSNSQEYIMFVTRAVRVIDLITNLDMSSFETHSGLNAFINRLEYEVNECRKEQPFTIPVKKQTYDICVDDTPLSPPRPEDEQQPAQPQEQQQNEVEMSAPATSSEELIEPINGIACYHQRSALLKSILNFFKKAIADSSNNNVPNLGDSIRHMMDASLPNSLKHIISNAEYYGPSLFLLATDVVQLFIFQEPSQLSQLQDNGLTDVILFALLKKNVPATREVLGSLPTVFSALCLNTRGLNAFIASKPFDKLFQVLLSPDYLPAMRRKRNTDQIGSTSATGSGTASQLGNAMDELMRHQPSLRIEAMNSIIKLLNQLIEMGKNPSFVCQRQNSNTKPTLSRSTDNRNSENVTATGAARHRRSSRNMDTGAGAAAQSSEDEDEEYENTMMVDSDCAATAAARNVQGTGSTATGSTPSDQQAANVRPQQSNVTMVQEQLVVPQPVTTSQQTSQVPSTSSRSVKQYECVPLLDYITNIMKFIEAILSNNSTDDHCKEFVKQKGLAPLLQILTLPNLPIDFPTSTACQSVAQVCKAILNLAREPLVYEQAFECLSEVLTKCETLYGDKSSLFEGSLLIREISLTENPVDSVNCPEQTPLLHSICCIHSFIYLLITLGKTNQNEIKNLTITNWGSPIGVKVLKNLCKLYMSLIWESSMLLWLSNEEQALSENNSKTTSELTNTAVQNFEFNKHDLERLKLFIASNNYHVNQIYEQVSDKMEEGMQTNEIKQSSVISHVSYNKLLRPLFNCASKLGRSLCEMFGSLVKLSAGAPWKAQSRRHIRPVEMNAPNAHAVNVANALAEICSSGFIVRLPSLEQLHPKFRLTFYICSVGFTSSILFDEFKRPFHLMLQCFEQTGGLKSLFDAFYWALSILDEKCYASGDKDKLQEGIIEFIESWLILIQKLVTTKLILESKYSINQQNQNPFSLSAAKHQKSSFDPIRFLFKIHKEAFNAIKCLWDKNFIRENQLSETILNILCQILTGDGVLQKKLAEREIQTTTAMPPTTTTTAATTTTASSIASALQSAANTAQLLSEQLQRRVQSASDFSAPVAPPPPPPINQVFLLQITSMGFSVEIATEALTKHPDSLEAALEYCCTHPVPTTPAPAVASTSVTSAPATTIEQQVNTTASNAPSNNDALAAALSTLVEDPDLLSDDNEQIRRAIAMSLGLDEPPLLPQLPQSKQTAAKDDKSAETSSKSTTTEIEDIRASQLDKQVLDEFSTNMLPGLFRILDNVPETVYRVCDLIVVVIRRYGDTWRDNCLNYILNEICELIKSICDYYLSLKDQPSSNEPFIKCANNLDQKLQSRLLLFSLLFEEMQLACSKIVNGLNLLDQLVNMLQLTTSLTCQTKNTTSPWLTSLFILIDLIEKSSLATKRKAAINDQYGGYKRVWKWYEERQNRWMSYPYANNKVIDDAYKIGETTIRTVVKGKHYTISFNSMLQISEETSHKRPIMLSFEKPSDSTTTSTINKNNNNVEINSTADTLVTPFGNITRHLNPNVTSDAANDATNDANISRPSSPLPIEVVRGLNSSQISTVLDCCVDFISYPVADSDCLHAILRLVLRLTRQHEYAVQFSARKGPQYILNLTQKSSFVGYASLVTLIFRHICEDEKNLRLTMEKTIRLALTGNQQNAAGIQPGSASSREFHNIMRVLGPAICRHPDLFTEVASDILRIVIKREDEISFLNGNQINTNSFNGYLLRTVQAKLMPATSLPDYAHELVIDLLNCLIKPLPQLTEQHAKINIPTTNVYEPTTKTKSATILDANPITTATNNIKMPAALTATQQLQPLLLKSGILRLLSELVRSYAGCAKIVTTHVYKAGQSETISEDYNAIAFLLDNFLPTNQTFGDKDCPSLCRLLIVALASCNHCLDSQNALVHEVKLAFNRALNLPESSDKHLKVQSLATIINTMIETCPAIANAPNNGQTNPNILRQQQQNMVNNMMKIMHKKGLINDLAHAPLYMDLSCSKCIESVNSILKPLETMSKTLNMTARKREIPPKPTTIPTLNRLPMATVASTFASIIAQNNNPSSSSNAQPLAQQQEASQQPLQQPQQVPQQPQQQHVQVQQQQQPQQQQETVTSTQNNIEDGFISRLLDSCAARMQEIQRSDQEARDAQMIDLNMTEMEPQQALPQDVDMPSVTSSRRNLDDRVLDRVIEALNQENSESDSEYEADNRIIRIQTDNNNEQIRIQIETTGEDEGDDNSDDEEASDRGIRISTMGYDNEGEHDHDENEGSSTDTSESDDSDDSDDDDDDEGDDDDRDVGEGIDDEDDEDDNVIDEELVEGSDGHSAVPSDISDDEHATDARLSNDPNDQVNTIANAVANALECADAVLDRNRDRDRDRDRDEEDDDDDDDDHDDDDDDDDNEEEEGEDANEEGMELDEDDEEIIEDEDEDDEEEEDEEDEEAIDENEDEHDDASEYYDAYNEMLDYINEDLNENDVREDDILMHLEDLWNQNHNMVLGQAITSNNGRAIQIAVNGPGNDISLPPHPLSVPVVHPLLAQHAENILGQHGASNAGNLQLANATSRMRHHHQQLRSRISRFIIPSLNLQLTATTPALTTPAGASLQQQQPQHTPATQATLATTARQSNLPYNTLNEILQGSELPMPGASYDMFVSGIYNPQMNSTQDAMTYNEAGENSTNLYIIRNPLARWNEECTVLDSHSMHHAIALYKPKILEVLEKYKNEELVEKRDKKAKEDEKLKKNKEYNDAAAADYFLDNKSPSNKPNTVTSEMGDANEGTVEQSGPIVTIEEPELVSQEEQANAVATDNQQPIENNPEQTPQETIQVNVEMSEAPKEEIIVSNPVSEQPVSGGSEISNQATDNITAVVPSSSSTDAEPIQQVTEEIAVSQEAATQFLLNFLSGTCNIFTIINADEKRIAIEALRISDNQRAAQEFAAMNIENYPQNFVFLDSRVLNLPSGIDPSFLSALPDNLRREVVLEQLRIQGIDIRNRQPAANASAIAGDATASTSTGITSVTTVAAAATSSAIQINPEFLAALPQQIQEELLQQQNLEQQMRAEGRDDDSTAFMRSLPPSLRQAILYDMDQSQISALPEDLASEARTLQQHIQNRERELDLFAATAAHRTSGTSYFGTRYTLGSGNRFYNSASLMNDNYLFASQNYGRLRRGLRHLNDTEMNPMLLDKLARGGRQLLDHESLACLLVLLFIDDTRLNTAKLHKVVRNLCIHGPSRAWIIKALLSILEKVSGKPETNLAIEPARKIIPVGQGAALKTTSSLNTSSSADPTKAMVSYQPSWLTMSIDGAFGSKTNVFTIYRSNTKKAQAKVNDSNTSISINPQACPSIIKQVLEILSTLARAANFNFFPKHPFKVLVSSTAASTATPNKNSATKDPQFWDLVIKLDQSKNKSSKLVSQKSLSSQTNLFAGPGGISQATAYDETDVDFSIENSPLARLMIMLENSVLKTNSSLMDKMFTCLAHASAGIPLSDNAPSATTDTENKSANENEAVLSKQIELVVDVLKNKACTQDGLNQAYTLLSNLSKINGATRNLIIKHLLDGTRELGYAVCQEIDTLLDEAMQYKPIEPVVPANATASTEDKHIIGAYPATTGGDEDTSDSLMNTNLPGTSYELLQQSTLQNFIDRYSNLVISSPKTKQVRELQLPSMSKLVEKNSNQKFFVRLIKLIINLRDAIEKEAKKKKQQLAQQQARTAAAAATATATAAAATTTTTDATEATTQVTSSEPAVVAEEASKVEQKKAEAPVLNRLSNELDLDTLWNKLSQCLSVLKSLSDPYAVLILQQTVEAFFYVHSTKKDKEETRKKEKETKDAQLAHLDSEYPMSPAAGSTTTNEIANANMEIQSLLNTIGNESPDTKKFLEFALTHRTVLNHILRQTSNNLSDEPYSVLIEFCRLHPSILDFDVKRRYFRQELDKLKDNIRGEDLAVHVKRSNVFDDSYRELNRRSADDWKHRFYIVFEGEEGQDAGGLLREWYLIISKEIFNPDYALFMINPGDRVTYMPNPSSHFNPNHLTYFRFIGRIIAKAIFDNKFLDCYFTRAFYKHILGVPVKYTDMESVDNEFFKNLVSIIESDIDTLGVDLTFSIDINEFGVTQSRDLKPAGHSIKVTNENKSEYIRLVCQEKMIGSIRQQVASFLQGFYEIIPKNLISIFNEQELELLISGLPEIDLEDLRRNTEYHKYTSSSLQIQWFWRALKAFDKEDQAKFLQFVTGTSKVPLQGFAKLEGMNGPQKFQIHRDDRDTSRLPSAHTCFNQLDLPAYENFEKLRNMLLMAIRECSTGFGLA